jgi:hypothetical protein
MQQHLRFRHNLAMNPVGGILTRLLFDDSAEMFA